MVRGIPERGQHKSEILPRTNPNGAARHSVMDLQLGVFFDVRPSPRKSMTCEGDVSGRLVHLFRASRQPAAAAAAAEGSQRELLTLWLCTH